jgi:eukaryotic-like serine/threonine-protein kinase
MVGLSVLGLALGLVLATLAPPPVALPPGRAWPLRETRGDGNLPEGTLLHGQLWTGPGIDEVWGKKKRPAVMGRYTQAILPDGRKYPVCIVLGERDGRVAVWEGSKPGAFLLGRNGPVSVVWRWP